MKTRIHVNQHVIRENKKKKEGEDLSPPLTIKTYKGNKKAYWAQINGTSRVIYNPESPLPCGAKVWIETEAEVQYE